MKVRSAMLDRKNAFEAKELLTRENPKNELFVFEVIVWLSLPMLCHCTVSPALIVTLTGTNLQFASPTEQIPSSVTFTEASGGLVFAVD